MRITNLIVPNVPQREKENALPMNINFKSYSILFLMEIVKHDGQKCTKKNRCDSAVLYRTGLKCKTNKPLHFRFTKKRREKRIIEMLT